MAEWAVFEAVEKALQETIRQEGAGYRTELDVATNIIRTEYSQAGLSDGSSQSLPFSNGAFRWAYTYRFVAAHVYLVQKVLNKLWETHKTVLNLWHNALAGSEMHVCCVGGGPGTDLIGLALFIQQQQLKVTRIRGDVLDCWPQWKDTFMTLSRHLDPENLVLPSRKMVKYLPFNFNKADSWVQLERIGEADLVTMVKFVSAVSANRSQCRAHLTVLMHHMKKGAILLVLDNAVDDLFELVGQAAADAGLHQISQVHYKTKGLQLPQREKTAIDSSPLRLAGLKSQKSSVISAFLWQKRFSRTALHKTQKFQTGNSNISPQHQNIPSLQPSEHTQQLSRSILKEKKEKNAYHAAEFGPTCSPQLAPLVPLGFRAPEGNGESANAFLRAIGKPTEDVFHQDYIFTSVGSNNLAVKKMKTSSIVVTNNSGSKKKQSKAVATLSASPIASKSNTKASKKSVSKTGSSPKITHSKSANEPKPAQQRAKNNNSSLQTNVSCPGPTLAGKSYNRIHKLIPNTVVLANAQMIHTIPQNILPASVSNTAYTKQKHKSSDVTSQTIPLDKFLTQLHEIGATSRDDKSTAVLCPNQSLVVSRKSLPVQAIPTTKHFDPSVEKIRQQTFVTLPAVDIEPIPVSSASSTASGSISSSADAQKEKRDTTNKQAKNSLHVSNVSSAAEVKKKKSKKKKKKKSKTVTAVAQKVSLKDPLNRLNFESENIKKAVPLVVRNDGHSAAFNCQPHREHLSNNSFHPTYIQTTVEFDDLAFRSSLPTTTVPTIRDSTHADIHSHQAVQSNSPEEFKQDDEPATSTSSSVMFWLGVSLLAIVIYRRYYNS